jgi:Plavaka transposase
VLTLHVAIPVDQAGIPLPAHTNPPPWDPVSSKPSFAPFEDRLSFDWAHYHIIECGSSEAKIAKGLDLWLAAKVQGAGTPDCEGIPWSCADELYSTVDEIQAGGAPFKTVYFQYSGPLPTNPPKWMTEKYELCVRDTRQVIKNTLSTSDFANEFNPQPYRQFHSNDDRMYSNLLSGDWAWREAVSHLFLLQ